MPKPQHEFSHALYIDTDKKTKGQAKLLITTPTNIVKDYSFAEMSLAHHNELDRIEKESEGGEIIAWWIKHDRERQQLQTHFIIF